MNACSWAAAVPMWVCENSDCLDHVTQKPKAVKMIQTQMRSRSKVRVGHPDLITALTYRSGTLSDIMAHQPLRISTFNPRMVIKWHVLHFLKVCSDKWDDCRRADGKSTPHIWSRCWSPPDQPIKRRLSNVCVFKSVHLSSGKYRFSLQPKKIMEVFGAFRQIHTWFQ